MIIEYQTFVDKNLLMLRYKGDLCIDTYKAQVLDMIQKPEWKFINKIFLDLRFVKTNSTINSNIVNDLIDIKVNVIKKKHFSVQLVDNTLLTALAHLYKQDTESKSFDSEFCSSTKKAIELLELNMNEEEFESILDNLEFTF